MKKMSRVLSLFLAVSMLLIVGCGSTASGNEDTTKSEENAATDTTGPLTPEEARNAIPDNLPEKDFGGKTFMVHTLDYLLVDVHADDLNGDVINDAVFNRNKTVEERFNVELGNHYMTDYTESNTYVQNSVMAGDDEFQLVSTHVVSLGRLVLNDVLLNWYRVPYIDFSQPWWSESTVNELTYGKDKAALAIGDYALSSLSASYCYFYDKVSAEEYKVGDLYQVVWDGKWTIDYVRNLVKDIYKDINGNGKKDASDFYGFTTSLYTPMDVYLWSSGGRIFERHDDGTLELVYNGEKTVEIIEKLYAFIWETDGVCSARPGLGWGDPDITYALNLHSYSFRDNLTFLSPGTLDLTVGSFRERENEYGILPYPKFDENQKDYLTNVDGYHAALAIPKTVKDTEFVGIITEALNAETYKQVYPAYYETALKVKYSYDDESVKMLDLIKDSRVFDFGCVYGAWEGFSGVIHRIVGKEKSKDFQSYYAKNSAAAEDYYNSILQHFEDME